MIRITTDKKIQEEISRAVQRQWEKDDLNRTISELNQRIWKLEKLVKHPVNDTAVCECAEV